MRRRCVARLFDNRENPARTRKELAEQFWGRVTGRNVTTNGRLSRWSEELERKRAAVVYGRGRIVAPGRPAYCFRYTKDA